MTPASVRTVAVLALATALVMAAPSQMVGAQPPAAPAAATLAGDLLKDWEAQKDTMMKPGDAMPPEKFSYKPTQELRTYAEQLMHVATSNVGLMRLLDPKAAAPALNDKAAAKADVLKALADSFDFGTSILKAQTNATLQETVQAPRFLGPSTRARVVYRTIAHTWDEYGAMTVYLRLNGIVPPASRASM
ncbi:MAG: DinB family protein [Acidobacteria bacterium]|nr:DinB family protein [Acidobacteriota bacterium]